METDTRFSKLSPGVSTRRVTRRVTWCRQGCHLACHQACHLVSPGVSPGSFVLFEGKPFFQVEYMYVRASRNVVFRCLFLPPFSPPPLLQSGCEGQAITYIRAPIYPVRGSRRRGGEGCVCVCACTFFVGQRASSLKEKRNNKEN